MSGFWWNYQLLKLRNQWYANFLIILDKFLLKLWFGFMLSAKFLNFIMFRSIKMKNATINMVGEGDFAATFRINNTPLFLPKCSFFKFSKIMFLAKDNTKLLLNFLLSSSSKGPPIYFLDWPFKVFQLGE